MFNQSLPLLMHIDFNSCFASIEQQANPNLIGKPIAVIAYDKPGGCILTPSREAKKYGVKTGMKFSQGLKLCPGLIPIVSDPAKYRFVHQALAHILEQYSLSVSPRSIDEFVVDFAESPFHEANLITIAQEIKSKIKAEIGDFLTVSIGISTNRFLAKLASNLQKPDGLQLIDKHNYLQVYQGLRLVDLPGIAEQTSRRLQCFDIKDVVSLYQASSIQLYQAFHSITAGQWYKRLRGFEVDHDWSTKSIGHEFSLPHALKDPAHFPSVLMKIAEKIALRLRSSSFASSGVHVAIHSSSGFFHQSKKLSQSIFTGPEIYQVCLGMIPPSVTSNSIHKISVSCFALTSLARYQLDLFGRVAKNHLVIDAIDVLTKRYGRFVVSSATMIQDEGVAPDAVGFGKVSI